MGQLLLRLLVLQILTERISTNRGAWRFGEQKPMHLFE